MVVKGSLVNFFWFVAWCSAKFNRARCCER